MGRQSRKSRNVSQNLKYFCMFLISSIGRKVKSNEFLNNFLFLSLEKSLLFLEITFIKADHSLVKMATIIVNLN